MRTIVAVIVYWRDVCQRAISDTATIVGSNWKKTLIAAILTGVAAFGLYRFEGGQAAFAKLEWWLLLLSAETLLFVLVLLPVFMRTPYLLHVEASGDLETKTSSLTEQLEEASADRDRLRTSDPRKNVIRSELEAIRDGFARIQAGLQKHNARSIEGFYNHDWKSYNYVQEHVPGYTQYGKTHNPVNTHTKKVKYEAHEFQQFAIICDDRIAQINRLIAMHS